MSFKNTYLQVLDKAKKTALQKGKIEVNSISKDKFINDDPDINFNSDDLLKTIQRRREKISLL